jgi:hypothetical protein
VKVGTESSGSAACADASRKRELASFCTRAPPIEQRFPHDVLEDVKKHRDLVVSPEAVVLRRRDAEGNFGTADGDTTHWGREWDAIVKRPRAKCIYL